MTTEEFKNRIEAIFQRNAQQPDRLNAQLGLTLEEGGMDPQPWAVFGYMMKEEHLNPYDGLHGGIVASLIDTCAGIGAVGLCNKYVTTTDLSVSYLRALTGDRFYIRVDFTHVGGRMISAMCKVINLETDELCATGMVSYMVLDKTTGLAN